MAEGDATVYNHFKEQLLLGNIDLVADTLKMILVGTGYSVSPDGNNGYANVSAQEISTTNYVAGGKTLGTKTVTQDDTGDKAKFDAADVTWTSLGTTTIGGAILYDDTITAAPADPLLVYWEIATNSNGNNYTLQFAATGVLTLS